MAAIGFLLVANSFKTNQRRTLFGFSNWLRKISGQKKDLFKMSYRNYASDGIKVL